MLCCCVLSFSGMLVVTVVAMDRVVITTVGLGVLNIDRRGGRGGARFSSNNKNLRKKTTFSLFPP